MKEANHLAAVEIFEKVNASLLPQNVLDLHGLHVDEAVEHLTTVLQQKTEGRVCSRHARTGARHASQSVSRGLGLKAYATIPVTHKCCCVTLGR